MEYIDLENEIHAPATGRRVRAEWGDGVANNFEFLRTARPTLIYFTLASQSIPNDSPTNASITVGQMDNGSWHNEDEPTELICPLTGLYLVAASARWASNATGRRMLLLYVNGVDSGIRSETHTTGNHSTSLGALIRLGAGDALGIGAYQSSGGNLTLNDGHVSVAWVGGA